MKKNYWLRISYWLYYTYPQTKAIHIVVSQLRRTTFCLRSGHSRLVEVKQLAGLACSQLYCLCVPTGNYLTRWRQAWNELSKKRNIFVHEVKLQPTMDVGYIYDYHSFLVFLVECSFTKDFCDPSFVHLSLRRHWHLPDIIYMAIAVKLILFCSRYFTLARLIKKIV